MSPAEAHIQGAEMARRIAREYRQDAQRNDIPEYLREKWLAQAARHEQRAEYYERVVSYFNHDEKLELIHG